jgi:hypothetical protein
VPEFHKGQSIGKVAGDWFLATGPKPFKAVPVYKTEFPSADDP